MSVKKIALFFIEFNFVWGEYMRMSTAIRKRLNKVQDKIISEVNLKHPYLNIHRNEDELSLFGVYLAQSSRKIKISPPQLFFNNLEYKVVLDSLPPTLQELIQGYIQLCSKYFYGFTVMYRGDGTFFVKEWEDISTTDSRDPEILKLIERNVKQEHLLTLEMQLCFMVREDAVLSFIGWMTQLLFDAAAQINIQSIKVHFETNLFKIYSEVVNKYVSEKHIRKHILSLENS